MNNIRKKCFLCLFTFLLIFCQGCTEIPLLDSEHTIVPPKNNLIPLQGSWRIKDFKAVSEEDSIEDIYKDWIDKEAVFTESFVILGNERCSNAKYKIRKVDTAEYFLFHYGLSAEELGIDEREHKIDIVSVSSDDKPFYEFIKIQDNQIMVYAYGGFYILEKVSDIVDNKYVDSYINAGEKREEEGSEQDLLRSGILLGLRAKSAMLSSENRANMRSTYRTLWIASYNRTLHPILEIGDLFVPRRSGFWKVGIKTQKIDEYTQDVLFAYPIEQEFHLPFAELEVIEKPQENTIKNIRFVGDDYVALEYIFEKEGETESRIFKVLPLDEIDSDKGIRISDIAGEDKKNIFYTSAETHLLSRNIKIPGKIEDIAQEDNFTLTRRNGHWILRGRLNYSGGYDDFTIGLSPVDTLVSYDELHVSWDSVKERVPAAVDAYASPNKDIILVITSSYIEIYAIKNSEIDDKPLRKIKLSNEETVVMAEWATGEYVARWEKSISQLNPFVVNDYID